MRDLRPRAQNKELCDSVTVTEAKPAVLKLFNSHVPSCLCSSYPQLSSSRWSGRCQKVFGLNITKFNVFLM